MNNRKDIDDLLTILLPLKERPDFTLRWMQYADKIKLPFKVFIADGGADSKTEEILSTGKYFKNVNYRYKRYPYDHDYKQFYKKMISAISEIDTPFVALTDNDVFNMPKGLHASLNFLVQHADYSSCRGQHLDFTLVSGPDEKPGFLSGSRLYINKIYYNKCHSIWRSFESNNPLVRIEDWSYCTHITYYNVQRINHFRDAWHFIVERNYEDIFLADITISMFTLLAGKLKVFDFPFILRQQNTPNAESKKAIKKADILDRMFVEKWTVDVNVLTNAVAENVSKAYGCDWKDASRVAMTCLKNHFADRLYAHLKQRDEQKPANRRDPANGAGEFLEISQQTEIQNEWRSVVDFLLSRTATRQK